MCWLFKEDVLQELLQNLMGPLHSSNIRVNRDLYDYVKP